jgi:hypothetical protein
MTNCLRIAFSIYATGKNGQFWINLAVSEWERTYGDMPVPAEVWSEVREIIEVEFSTLLTSRVNRGIEALARGEDPSTAPPPSCPWCDLRG